MLKNLGFVTFGLVAGLIIMTLMRPPGPSGSRLGQDKVFDETAAAGVDALQSVADARIAALEERVARLEERPAAVAPAPAAPAAVPAAASSQPTATSSGARLLGPEAIARLSAEPAMTTALQAAQSAATIETQRLVTGGFAPDRADWIRRKIDELRMQELQARYEAQRSGAPWPANEFDASFVNRKLRAEMGDDDYERYVRAMGGSTDVAVSNVYAGSPAATAGIRPGDRIVSYGGKRVFDQVELNAFILEGTPGESVVLEVDRSGQRLQVVVPRGPMGVTGGGTLNIRSTYGVTNSVR